MCGIVGDVVLVRIAVRVNDVGSMGRGVRDGQGARVESRKWDCADKFLVGGSSRIVLYTAVMIISYNI